MSKKQKKDKRVWVDPSRVHQYVGTIDSLKSVDKLLAGTPRQLNDAVTYYITAQEFNELVLIPRLGANQLVPDVLFLPLNWWIAADGDDIFIAKSRKKLDKQIRVRTGLVKVTVTIERDDKVIEYLVPSASYVDLDDSYHYGLSSTLNIQITNPLKDERGSRYYRVDRNMNPDWSYVKFLRGDYDGDEVSFS